jgi:hypothetical protein
MGLINTDKKYKSLSTFGCSYTTGFLLGDKGSWGFHLAELLNCKHNNLGGGQSNPNILNGIIRYCETNDMTDCCVGIEWSEVTRREVWDKEKQKYNIFGVNNFDKVENHKPFINEDNLEFFTSIWFDLNENILRTVNSIILAKSYLQSKNIDFIMFEGINSIMDVKRKKSNYDIGQEINLIETILLNDEYKMSLLNDVTFFNKFGNWHQAMFKNPLFDSKKNRGHPNMEIVKWWAKEIYDYLLINKKQP